MLSWGVGVGQEGTPLACRGPLERGGDTGAGEVGPVSCGAGGGPGSARMCLLST